ncbi:hypothetical protein [uncultured Bradyrhizobium sp.]|jgi:hypothetical protein|uniref:hypothetical protein n=1 Tax=uncultured Bradyrhizobium sp. TaxID=199684 RepID=UPI002637A07F|nr:hypothetical protein [uncultured Bradyrhizobium sp.]
MNGWRCIATWVGLAVGLSIVPSGSHAASVVLITTEEARLAPARQLASSRGIFRAPRIEVGEQLSGPVHSPIHFKLIFRAFGGSSIDPGSVSVTYLKSTDVDLTPRIRPFLTSGGIEIPEAEVPPGNHVIKVSVHDSDGREGTTQFSLTVNPAD